jgi:hypothetical protein
MASPSPARRGGLNNVFDSVRARRYIRPLVSTCVGGRPICQSADKQGTPVRLFVARFVRRTANSGTAPPL